MLSLLGDLSLSFTCLSLVSSLLAPAVMVDIERRPAQGLDTMARERRRGTPGFLLRL